MWKVHGKNVIDETLRMRREGLSASDVARVLGINKNAVIGLWYRHATPADAPPVRLVRPRAVARIVHAPADELAIRSEPQPQLAPLPVSHKICCYPIGDPREEDFRFCDQTQTIGPYCVDHAKICFTPLGFAKLSSRRS